MVVKGAADHAHAAARAYLIAGICAVIAFTFITAPFQVPDEVGHFWRAVSIAHGTVLAERAGGATVAPVPEGIRTLVFVLWRDARMVPRPKIGWSDFKTATYVRLSAGRPVEVQLPAVYTPVAYLPQIAAALIGRATGALPLITFYLGRLLSALAFVLIVWWAIRITPVLQWGFLVAALLPMTLTLAASWSADAMTIALSFLFTAALLRATRFPPQTVDVLLLSATGAFLGLCKPGYALVALLALAVAPGKKREPSRGLVIAAIVIATVAGSVLSIANASRTPVVKPSGADAQAQIDCIREEPLRFVKTIAREYRARGLEYLRQAIGRLGILDVPLPAGAIWMAAILLLVSAFTGDASPPLRVRLIAAAVAIVTIAGIAATLYVSWTPLCAPHIEGIQGRYFLPTFPLILAVFTAPVLRRERIAAFVFVIGMALVDVMALGTLVSRYWV